MAVTTSMTKAMLLVFVNWTLPFSFRTEAEGSMIPEAYHGRWVWMEYGQDFETHVTGTGWGDLASVDLVSHDKTSPDLPGVNSTLLLTEDVFSRTCYFCLDVFYRTPNVLQVRKSGCYAENSGLAAMCSGHRSEPSFDQLTTYFRKLEDARTTSCRSLIEGRYQFSYEMSRGGGGVCNSSHSFIDASDNDQGHGDSEVFLMTFAQCPEVAASFSKTVRYQCLGSWLATVKRTGYTFAAISDTEAEDPREQYKCLVLITTEGQDPPDGQIRWGMSRFADCGWLYSMYAAPARLTLRPFE